MINLSLDEWGPSVPSETCLKASHGAKSQQGKNLTFWMVSLIMYSGAGEYQWLINWASGSIIKWVKKREEVGKER